MSFINTTGAPLTDFVSDPRIADLLNIALTAYEWLPDNLMNVSTFTPVRDDVKKSIEAFGLRCEPIPWHRFPKRFHRNKPKLVIFRADATDSDVSAYMAELLAAQPVRRSVCSVR